MQIVHAIFTCDFLIQTQSDKYKKLYEDAKQKCEGLEAQLVSLRKVSSWSIYF